MGFKFLSKIISDWKTIIFGHAIGKIDKFLPQCLTDCTGSFWSSMTRNVVIHDKSTLSTFSIHYGQKFNFPITWSKIIVSQSKIIIARTLSPSCTLAGGHKLQLMSSSERSFNSPLDARSQCMTIGIEAKTVTMKMLNNR